MTVEQQSVDERIAEIEADLNGNLALWSDRDEASMRYLIAELRSARKDSERLDWLEAHLCRDEVSEVGYEWRIGWFTDDGKWTQSYGPTFRAATDNAAGSILPEQER